jgi:hypothetical protein
VATIALSAAKRLHSARWPIVLENVTKEFGQGALAVDDVSLSVEVEELGSDAFVFFSLDAEAVVIEAARTAESDEDTTLLIDNDRELFAARVDPRTAAQVGQQLRLALDPSRLYYFSPETGESLLADRH